MEPVYLYRQLLVSLPTLDGVALKFVPTALLTHVLWKYAKRRNSCTVKDAKQQNE